MSKKKLILKTIVSFCLILIVFLNAAQTAMARETMSVIIVPPAKTTMAIGDVIRLQAQASGGPGLYNYGLQWYLNDTAIEYATWTPYTFAPNQTGIYNFKCDAFDSTGETTESVTSSTLTLTVTEKSQASSQSPETSDLPGVGASNSTDIGEVGVPDQWLLLTAGFVVVVVVIVAAFFVVKRRGSKKAK